MSTGVTRDGLNKATDERRWFVAAAATTFLLAVIFLGSPNFRYRSSPDASPFAGDFLQEWIGGHVVLHGNYDRFYDVSYAQSLEHNEQLIGFEWKKTSYFPLVYPPFYYLLVSPLRLLPLETAAFIWAGAMIATYVAAWFVFSKTTNSEKKTWLLPASLLFMPLIESLTSCQKGTILLLILAATYYLLTTKRPYLAGFVFGLIAFKPQFALPIAIIMLCKQQWRFALGGLTSGGILAALSLAMGVDVCRQYIDFSFHAADYLQNAGYDLMKSHAWHGFFTLLLHENLPGLARPFTLVAGLATIALVALAMRGRLETTHPRFAWQYCSLVLMTVLLSPHLYTYDLTVLLLPMWLVATRADCSQTQRALAVVLFCFVGLSPQFAALSGVQVSVLVMFAWLTSFATASRECNYPVRSPASASRTLLSCS